MLRADRTHIEASDQDLSFITVRLADKDGMVVPIAKNDIVFSVTGPGEIVATDNGDPSNLVSFSSHTRAAFNGLCLVIVRAKTAQPGIIHLKAWSAGIAPATIVLTSKGAR